MREFIYDLDITPIITQAREQFRIYCETSKMGEGWFWGADNLIESFVLREMFLRVHLYSHHGDTHRRLRESAAEYAREADLLLDVDTQKISFLWDVLLRDAFLQVMMIKPENYDIKTMLIGAMGCVSFLPTGWRRGTLRCLLTSWLWSPTCIFIKWFTIVRTTG